MPRRENGPEKMLLGKKYKEASDTCKNTLIENVQLYTPRQENPFELEVTILDYIVLWRSWQTTEKVLKNL